jgi:hypothetical protein
VTWAKFGTEFSDELLLAGISDAAFRTHTEAIMWIYHTEGASERVSLAIPKRLLPKIATTPECELAAEELRDAGLWRKTDSAWVVEHHADVVRQSIAAQRAKRDGDRERQRRSRDRKRDVAPNVTHDVTHDVAATQTDRQPGTKGEPDSDLSQNATCIGPDCRKPARRGCRTCWDHVALEAQP